jgi:protease-4
MTYNGPTTPDSEERMRGHRILITLLTLTLTLAALTGCGRRTLRLDFVPVEEKLQPVTVSDGDGGFLSFDKVAVVNVSGLISTMKSGGLLSMGSGDNKVSDFRETLDAVEKDPSVKAVVLRINSPGGTVTASDVMYKDLMAFRQKTHKPVVVQMMDVCASGGYYLSCAADYRFAYPTTVTGSIGVIIQTLNFSGTLNKLGISAEAITSRENKDMGSPLRPMTDNDRKLLKGLVDQFYAGFLDVVKNAPNHVNPDNWPWLTDGRVVTGRDAVKYGLIDALGTLDDAIAKAKEMAGIRHARIIMYSRKDEAHGSVYATGPDTPAAGSNNTAINLINVNVPSDALVPSMTPQFLYLWTGQ